MKIKFKVVLNLHKLFLRFVQFKPLIPKTYSVIMYLKMQWFGGISYINDLVLDLHWIYSCTGLWFILYRFYARQINRSYHKWLSLSVSSSSLWILGLLLLIIVGQIRLKYEYGISIIFYYIPAWYIDCYNTERKYINLWCFVQNFRSCICFLLWDCCMLFQQLKSWA